MNAVLLYWLLSTLAYAAFGLIVGASVYLTLRAIEKWDREYALLINALAVMSLWVLYSSPLTGPLPAIGGTAIVLVVGGVAGFKLHLKSGGNSASPGAAMVLMGVATLLAIIIDSAILMFLSSYLPRRPPHPFYLDGVLYLLNFFLLFAPVILTPLLLCLYQNLRLRPGIDMHLNENEDAETSH